jgi:hypothetical protein
MNVDPEHPALAAAHERDIEADTGVFAADGDSHDEAASVGDDVGFSTVTS